MPEEIHKIMHCIVCGKSLETEENEVGDTLCIFPVYDGVMCRIYGNYGSTKYDPLNEDEILHFVLCDECLVKKADKIQREQFVRLALAPNKIEKKIKVRESFSKYLARISSLKKERDERFEEEKKRCLEKEEHFWLSTPKTGRFICCLCGKILDEEYIFQLEHFRQVWDGVCYGSKEAREEVKEEREWYEHIMQGKAFEFWNSPEEDVYTMGDGDLPE